jgi:hypothetical protein
MPGTTHQDLETVSNYDAILTACRKYIEGGSTGDAQTLREAFHPEARVFGNAGGTRLDVPIESFIKIACDAPVGRGGKYRARVLSVLQSEDAAVAVVAEDGCWGAVSFVDYLSLTRVDGVWKIANKTFALTGGTMPKVR